MARWSDTLFSLKLWSTNMVTVSPDQILVALAVSENEWPVLVGAQWPKIEPKLNALRDKLEKSEGIAQMRAAAELVQLLAPYTDARERLNDAIAAQTETGKIVLQLAEFAKFMGLDPEVSRQIRNAPQLSSTKRFIWQSSPTKATSLKLANVVVSFDFGMFSEFLVGLLTTSIKDVIGEANGILRAAGVLLMIASLYKATALKLDEREATVFYGFAQAGREAKEDLILANTNKVRHAVSLRPLDKIELGNALHRLAEFKSIERVKGSSNQWRIIEKHKTKPIS
jgi:hypothetical protein